MYLFWGQAFRSTATGQTGTGTYGYYRVNDLATRGAVNANIQNLYVQDTWTVGSRLTLNLGLRTENEKIPTFRPDIAQYAFQFGFADKLAPRLGATYDVRGDGRLKAFASWGRYYDWTKYEIARGSFGGDLWHIYYRSLDTLDIGSLNLSNMPGPISGAARPASATSAPPRSATPIRTSSRCSRTASMRAWTIK